MNKLRGSYVNISSKNIESFYLAINAYCSAFLTSRSRPGLTIFREGGVWTIFTHAHRLTYVDIKFGEEFVDAIESYKDDFKGMATFNGDTLKIVSTSAMTHETVIRTYEPTRSGCILNFMHPKSGIRAKRVYIKVPKDNLVRRPRLLTLF